MLNIYLDNRKITISADIEDVKNDPNTVIYIDKNLSEIADIPQIFYNSPNIQRLHIKSDNPLSALARLGSRLTPISAGGGLVTNNKGEYLFIFRRRKWDLPKGKQDPGEKIKACALREVEEECGLKELTIENPLCKTYHIYHRNNLLWLKETQWFKMKYTGNGNTIKPQKEEDIEIVEWVNKAQLPTFLENTYPSIKEVFMTSNRLLSNLSNGSPEKQTESCPV